MICADLEKLEAEFDDIVTALEDPRLDKEERRKLQDAWARMTERINQHHRSGHQGGPCFEDPSVCDP